MPGAGKAAAAAAAATAAAAAGSAASEATAEPVEAPSGAGAAAEAAGAAVRAAMERDECPYGDGSGAEMSADAIIKAVGEVQAFPGTAEERRNHFRERRKDFRDACPTLFDLACRRGVDFGMLAFMLNTRDRVGAGEENDWAADKVVGRKLADRYLPI